MKDTYFVIVYKKNHRKVSNTPEFDYAVQAIKYLENWMGNSPYLTIEKRRR